MPLKDLSRYAMGYALWAVSVVVAGLVGLILREAIMSGLTVWASSTTGVDARHDFYLGYQLRAVDPWTYVLYGLLLIVVIVILEHFYREGATKGILLSRFLKVFGILVGILAFAHILNYIIAMVMGGGSWAQLALIAIEVVVSGVFIWLSRRAPTQSALIQ